MGFDGQVEGTRVSYDHARGLKETSRQDRDRPVARTLLQTCPILQTITAIPVLIGSQVVDDLIQ